jgi:hypothetical protein
MPTVSAAQPVYSYIRSFQGIIGQRTTPPNPTKASLMGARADEYFSAHGYRPGTVQLIQTVYEDADDMDAFVAQLSRQGVAITEAQYMYSLIHGN